MIAAPIASHEITRSCKGHAAVRGCGRECLPYIHSNASRALREDGPVRRVRESLRGNIREFPGVDEVYEAPKEADLTVNVTRRSVSEIVHCEWFLSHVLKRM